MLGAIVGDIVGSVYEWQNIKTKDFPFFRSDCFFTDDTVMVIAVAEALISGGQSDDFIDAMKKYGRLYPNADYGGRFGMWVRSDDRHPYGSWGNGSAMRVSPCAQYALAVPRDEDDFASRIIRARELARTSAAVTHDHPEGIKGAEATVHCLMLAYGYEPEEAKRRMRRDIPRLFNYDLTASLDQIRPTYCFSESCQDTVPPAITSFLESTGFEDAIRNAISLGGDSDTLAAITGSIAEAAYGVPKQIEDRAMIYLDDRLRNVCSQWRAFIDSKE